MMISTLKIRPTCFKEEKLKKISVTPLFSKRTTESYEFVPQFMRYGIMTKLNFQRGYGQNSVEHEI